MALAYTDCLARLNALAPRGIRPSILAFSRALEALSLRFTYRRILIAGTNGKGSVSAMTASALRLAGLKVGLLTSPHLVDVRERIQLNGEWIATSVFAAHFDALWPIIEQFQLTYYESLVLLGVVAFERAAVDVAVLEVGMGGRFDATNALDPQLTAITTVSFDHQAYLGTTLAEIAREKAGIVRPGVPLVCGATDDAACAVIKAICRENGAPYEAVAEVVEVPIPEHLPGRHQLRNAAIALRLLKHYQAADPRLGDAHLMEGIRTARHPGRLQRIVETPPVYLDGAHNREGMAALQVFLNENHPNRLVTLIFSIMKDKDYRPISDAFSQWVSQVYFVELPEPRALDYATFAAGLSVPCERLPLDALTPAFLASLPPDRVTVICGSLYLVGTVLENLKYHLAEGRESFVK